MINERKFKILCHCNIVPSGLKDTSEALGLPYGALSSTMCRMVAEELLSLDDGLYATTPTGRIELRLFKEALQRIVPAPKIDKFDGVYIPSVSYQRNQGNKHIQSRGF